MTAASGVLDLTPAQLRNLAGLLFVGKEFQLGLQSLSAFGQRPLFFSQQTVSILQLADELSR